MVIAKKQCCHAMNAGKTWLAVPLNRYGNDVGYSNVKQHFIENNFACNFLRDLHFGVSFPGKSEFVTENGF